VLGLRSTGLLDDEGPLGLGDLDIFGKGRVAVVEVLNFTFAGEAATWLGLLFSVVDEDVEVDDSLVLEREWSLGALAES